VEVVELPVVGHLILHLANNTRPVLVFRSRLRGPLRGLLQWVVIGRFRLLLSPLL